MTSIKKTILVIGAVATFATGVSIRSASIIEAAGDSIASLPTENPSNFTPNVLNGQVNSIWQVGNRVIIGGTFTQVANSDSNGGAIYNRLGIAAFDATTGVVDTAFAPTLSATVEVVIPAADGTSIYVGGDFNTVNGVNRRKVARIDAATGALVTSFNAGGLNGLVRDLRLVGTTLYVAGLFTTVAGQSRTYLASLNAQTGALTTSVNVTLAGLHNGGVGKVIKIDATPDGSRLLITGNFTSVNGQPRDQVALIDLTTAPAVLSPWHTNFFTSACATSFDSFMRDLDISEDGTFAVFSTTGAYRVDTSCDTISRLELGTEQANLSPTWISYTGGDTTYATEIHDGVLYVGGHMRWVNNPFAADRHGAGGVAREGMAALDVTNGLPYSWDPGRERGVGLFDYHVTEQGIWAGSDTERFNDEARFRLAFFPWSTGISVPTNDIGDLPNDIFQLGRTAGTTGTVDQSVLYRINAGGPLLASADDGPAWAADTASTSSFRNSGSSTGTAPSSLSTPANDSSVPKGDLDRPPAHLWTTERYDPATGSEMAWVFPVAAGTPIQVRLYLSNRATATNNVGERIFDVDLDGLNVLNDLDLSGDVGHDIGTMRAFDIVSDGSVNILFRHGVENPLINGIEIIRRDITPSGTLGTQDDVVQHQYDGVTPPTNSTVVAGTVPWRTVRGAFMVNSTLYTFHLDGSVMRRTLDGSTFGPGVAIDVWSNNIMTDMASMTGIFYDPSTYRIYYTVSGQSSLYYRTFTPQSHTMGAVRSIATGDIAGLSPSRVRGMFLGQGRLWFGDDATGNLLSVAFVNGLVTGTPTTANATIDWRSRALFRSTGAQPNVVPVANFTSNCSINVCSFDGALSTDSDGTIISYDWTFGDGGTATGITSQHSYAAAGTYTVTLTVVDDRGGVGQHQVDVNVANPPNVPPTASISPDCALLGCSFDASGSSDSDGVIVSYSWDFGDGATGSGSTTSHDYAIAGTYHVTLTVTDDDGAPATAETDIDAIAPGAAALFRAAASANSSTTSPTIVVPAQVQLGDQLVYVVTANAATTATTPSGWTLLATAQDGTPDTRSWVFTRAADASTAGSTVTLTLGVLSKSARTLVAYSNATPPTAALSSTMGASSTALTTPPATVTYTGSAVVSYWSDKSASNSGWVTPPSVTLRSSSVGSGSGRITAAIADANAPIGTWPGATANSTVAGTKGIGWTIVVPPATGNLPPTATFSSSCASLSCVFDATGSSDPDGTIVSYGWDFGDGATGTGATPNHVYLADGFYNVVLTVTDDDGTTATFGATVSVSLAVVGFRTANSSNQNSSIASVGIPAAVQSGDQLLLFVTTNVATTLTTPSGWSLLGTAEAGSPDVRSWVFTRTADGTTSGTTVQTTLGLAGKSSSVLLAYSGATTITLATAAVSPSSSTMLTTPSVTVATSGSIVVSYWADKTSANTGWTLPSGVITRANSVGSGSGRITSAAGDTSVAAGTWPGATATSTVAGAKSIGWTVVVSAP